MPKIKYKNINIRKSGLALIEQVNGVIDLYEQQGYSLTLRQVYYQLVSKNIIPNSEKEYNNLGVLINNGRLAMFGANVSIKRIALNMPQIEQYEPPPNPAKTTNSRSSEYIKRYGVNSWELDALEPKMLDGLISDNILKYIDMDKFKRAKIRQDQERQKILNVKIG